MKCKIFKMTNGKWLTIYPYAFYTDRNRVPSKSVTNDTWEGALHAALWYCNFFKGALTK